MTQEQLDAIVAASVAKALANKEAADKKTKDDAESAAKEKELLDQGKYKELAEKQAKDLEDLKAQLAKQSITDLRTKIAIEAGFIGDSAALANAIVGDDEKSMRESAEGLKKFLTPTKPAAPNIGTGEKTGGGGDSLAKTVVSKVLGNVGPTLLPK
jgi:hypothetical protein